MGLFNKLLLLVLVLALASPFLIKKQDGTPLMSISEFLKPAQSITQSVLPASKPQALYRWKDAKGNWQYSDQPPENNQAEVVQVEDKINSMKTIELPDGYKDQEQAEPTERFDPTSGGSSIPLTTAPLEKVPDMLNQIEGFQKSMDDRNKQLDAIGR